MYRLFFFIFLTINVYLTSNAIAVTENEPSSLVEGVSVITGDFYLQEEDVVITMQNILFKMFFFCILLSF